MDYRMEARGPVTLVGAKRTFAAESAASYIPRFWNEYYRMGWDGYICPRYGVSLPNADGENSFSYLIGNEAPAGTPPMPGFTAEMLPAADYAVFSCTGALPEALKKLTNEIFTHWLPENGRYRLASDLMIEDYSDGDTHAENYRMELWLPVVEK